MNINLIVFALLFIVALIIFIGYLIAVKKIYIKYGIVWMCLFFILLLSIVIPGLLEWLTDFLGFQTASNMVLCLIAGLLIVVSIINTVALTTANKKNRILAQEISIIKKQIEIKEQRNSIDE